MIINTSAKSRFECIYNRAMYRAKLMIPFDDVPASSLATSSSSPFVDSYGFLGRSGRILSKASCCPLLACQATSKTFHVVCSKRSVIALNLSVVVSVASLGVPKAISCPKLRVALHSLARLRQSKVSGGYVNQRSVGGECRLLLLQRRHQSTAAAVDRTCRLDQLGCGFVVA